MTEREIPTGWRETTLGEVVVLNYGKGLVASKRVSGNVPVYGSSGVTGWHNESYVKSGGLIVGRKGSVGSIFKSTVPFFPIDTVYYITEKDLNGDIDFFFYLLSNLKLDQRNSDSAVPGLNRNEAYSLPILLPPLPEQEAIAKILGSLDDKIELLREQNETLEQMGQELFKEWFGRYSPDRSEELPEGWRVGKLGEVVEITSGKRPQSINEIQTSSHSIPLIGATKIMGYVHEFLFEGKTLIIGRVGTHGEVQRFNEKIFPSDNTLVLKSDYFDFIYQILKDIDYEILNRGAVQPLITQTDLKNYGIIIPSSEVMKNFNKIIVPLFEKKEKNNEQIQSLSATRDTLLPKLMSGEVRVEF